MLLSAIVFIPLLGSLVIAFLPRQNPNLCRAVGIAFAAAEMIACLLLLAGFNYSQPQAMQFEERHAWIPQFGISYHMGVDGLSMPLVVLTGLLTLLSLIYSVIITERPKEYYALFLLLAVGMQGVFLSLDYFLFYIFWEVSLVPMYFLIGIWGGPQREFAAIKFFLYTLVGSLAMLLAILAIYFNTGAKTLNILEIAQMKPFGGQEHLQVQMFVFLGFFLAFAVKLPLFPFHTWLPLAHVEAPTAGSVILAGILLKMGGYGFLRIALPTFPEAAFALSPTMALLALVSIIYGALVAMAQTDMKRMIANSSINHMGYCMLGIAAAAAVTEASARHAELALTGAVLQMVAHGLITGALFFMVGVAYERTHNRDMTAYGGLGAKVPLYAGFLSFFAFASLGLPGLAGFVSEFMVFIGSFRIFTLHTALALCGVVVTAAFFLLMIQRMLLGPLNEKYRDLSDMNKLEVFCLVPLMILTLWIGLYPAPVISVISGPVNEVLEIFLH